LLLQLFTLCQQVNIDNLQLILRMSNSGEQQDDTA
jgi:hypothetical protein